MHQLVLRGSFTGAVAAVLLLATAGMPAAPAGPGKKAQTAAVEKQAGAGNSKPGGQSIVALVNDEPVTAYEIEQRARKLRLTQLFVLTTKTAHWFLERGFRTATISDLPQQKQALYNYQRKSLVYVKNL